MNISLKKWIHTLQSPTYKKRSNRIIIAGVVSLIAYIMILTLSFERSLPYSDKMIEAARIMEKAVIIIRDHCNKSGVNMDNLIDPNHTGLIGPKHSGLTTTLGNLRAKRTTTNPNIAGLIVYLLNEAGVKKGKSIAIGSSASFPALMIASLSAAKAMDVHPVIIISIGSSSYGATNINFTLLDIYKLLLKEGIFSVQPSAISLGGERDIGENFKPEIKEILINQIRLSGIPFIYESDLQKNVSTRIKIYKDNAPEKKISAFINSGGSYANFGTSPIALRLKPGLNKKFPIPSKEKRGVLFEMAEKNIPSIHLLFIKGLVQKFGLPWDPIPLPKPGKIKFIYTQPYKHPHFRLISIIYFVVLFLIILYKPKKNKK